MHSRCFFPTYTLSFMCLVTQAWCKQHYNGWCQYVLLGIFTVFFLLVSAILAFGWFRAFLFLASVAFTSQVRLGVLVPVASLMFGAWLLWFLIFFWGATCSNNNDKNSNKLRTCDNNIRDKSPSIVWVTCDSNVRQSKEYYKSKMLPRTYQTNMRDVSSKKAAECGSYITG